MAKKTAEEKLEAGISLIREAFSESKASARADLVQILTGAARSVGKPSKAAAPAKKPKQKRAPSWPAKGTMEYKQRVNKLNASRGKDLGFPKIADLFGRFGPPKGWKTPKKRAAKKATKKTARKK